MLYHSGDHQLCVSFIANCCTPCLALSPLNSYRCLFPSPPPPPAYKYLDLIELLFTVKTRNARGWKQISRGMKRGLRARQGVQLLRMKKTKPRATLEVQQLATKETHSWGSLGGRFIIPMSIHPTSEAKDDKRIRSDTSFQGIEELPLI